jgi:two-component system response regulator DctR
MLHIIDDDEEMRNSLVFLAKSRAIVTKTYENGLAFLSELDKGNAYDPKGNCILVDMQMPGMSGLELFDILMRRKLIERFPVIFLTAHAELPTAVSVLKRGAFDFFEKPFHGNNLLESVQEGMKASQRAWEKAGIEASLATLSAREYEVLSLILHGRTNTEIASMLGISGRTIEVHRAHILKKMKVKTALDLAILLGSNIDISEFIASLNPAYNN